ncbi:MAG: sigma-70 family RNA polymerase sigma factor [Spirulinaceae cyanobacterium SM2_1_0]|nr:sigma-70 family RNA polymerase sigma factor [Spirulinaceae cyanobacterium SM2_1_0]
MRRSATADPIKSYLQSIGRTPLLTRQQEIDLAQQVQVMLPLLEKREREPLTPEEVTMVEQGQAARQKMAEANLRLVVSIAKRYQNRGLSLLDLIQEGSLGLFRAVEKFDPDRGYKFSTYAYWWIRQAMTRSLAEQSRTIRLPLHITEELNKIKQATRQLTIEQGRQPTEAELAEHLELKPERLQDIRRASHRTRLRSLDARVRQEDDTSLGDLIADESDSPQDFAAQDELRSQVAQLMESLPDRQREILMLRFGFDTGEGLSFKEIGKRCGISHERARQLQKKALRALRRQAPRLRELAVS